MSERHNVWRATMVAHGVQEHMIAHIANLANSLAKETRFEPFDFADLAAFATTELKKTPPHVIRYMNAYHKSVTSDGFSRVTWQEWLTMLARAERDNAAAALPKPRKKP